MSLAEELEHVDGPSCQSEVSPAPVPAETSSPQDSPGSDPNDPPRPTAKRRPAKGFGIVELLNVVLIVAVLATIAIVVANGAVQRAREAAAMAYLRSWPLAMENFRLANDRYASSLEELLQSGYLGRMGPDRVQYTFSLGQKVTFVPGSLGLHARRESPGRWQAVLARWRSSGVAWAAGKGGGQGNDSGGSGNSSNTGGDADKGHGNDPDRCDEDNPGQGSGGPCNRNGDGDTPTAASGGAGWEGWATPVGGKGRHFYIDETGTIRYAVNTGAGASSPPIP